MLIAAADVVLYPLYDNAADVVYTRVGAVYPDAAKIVVRYPDEGSREVLLQWQQTNIISSALDDEPWIDGPVLNLTETDDWVGTVMLKGLWPSTSYQCELLQYYTMGSVTCNISWISSDRLAYSNGTTLAYPEQPIQFHTFPDPRLSSSSHFRFISTSCMTPNFPYKPFQGRIIHGMDLLARYLGIDKGQDDFSSQGSSNPDGDASSESAEVLVESSKVPTEFMIFMGDFIYADVPVYWGDDKETYRRLYRRNYNSPSFRKIYERLRK